MSISPLPSNLHGSTAVGAVVPLVSAVVPLPYAVVPPSAGLLWGVTVGLFPPLYKGVFFPILPYLLSSCSSPLLTFFELANSQSLHGFLLVFEGKERGDLDPHFHQSLSPLCEGNPLDLYLGVLGVLLLVLPLFFHPSISCFGGI